MDALEILLNGQKTLTKSITIEDLLAELRLGSMKVAVELNRNIVGKNAYASTKLAAGDQLEIIHFVGGG